MPTVAQVRELPELCRIAVPRDWEDINGHVNVQYYLRMYDLTAVPMLEALGIDEDWVRRERIGLFDLEHHIWYLDEIHVGHEVTAHVRFARAQRQAHPGRAVPGRCDASGGSRAQ